MSSSSAEFRTVVDELSRERLADGVVCAIEKCFGYDNVTEDDNSIPRPFRLAHIVYQTTGYLAGDGLHGLLQLPCRRIYPTYLRELGFRQLARRLQRFVRWNFVYGEARISNVEQELYSNNARIYLSVGDYIANNAIAFESLLPHLRETLAYLEHFDPAGYERKVSEPDPRTEWLKALAAGLTGEMSVEETLKVLNDRRNR